MPADRPTTEPRRDRDRGVPGRTSQSASGREVIWLAIPSGRCLALCSDGTPRNRAIVAL